MGTQFKNNKIQLGHPLKPPHFTTDTDPMNKCLLPLKVTFLSPENVR